MRHAFIGLCIFTAACSGQPVSPTSPSGVAGVGAQTQASGGRPVEVTFTKWVTAFPAMAGVTGGDVPGTFAGTVLSRDPFDNGTIVQLEARYGVIAADGAHSFVAHIEGKQNNSTQTGRVQRHCDRGMAGRGPGTCDLRRHRSGARYFLRARGAGEQALLPGHDSHYARLGELRKKAERAAQCKGMRKRLRCESALVKT